MYNNFLLNEGLTVSSISEIEEGINRLNEVIAKKDRDFDNFIKHGSIYTFDTGFGNVNDFTFSVISEEHRRLIPKLLGSFIDYQNYITNEAIFDTLFPNECNGFSGFNFSTTTIPVNRQIIDKNSFILFKSNCRSKYNFHSMDDFDLYRGEVFPNLIFCENAIDQIHTYAVTDDRFKLIIAKLKRLDSHTSKWTDGNYDFDTLGLDCSPDTKKRIYDTLNFRTIGCPEIGPVVFSWHIKWYFSGQSFRMYIHPQASNHKMYIGYIGDKKGMGF